MRRFGLSVVCLVLALSGPNGPDRVGAQVSDYQPQRLPPAPPKAPELPPQATPVVPAVMATDWKWEPARPEVSDGMIVRVRNIICPCPRAMQTIICPLGPCACENSRLVPAPVASPSSPAPQPEKKAVEPPPAAEPPVVRAQETLSPRLCIEKLGPASSPLGKSLTYEIIVRNVHSTTVRNVRLEDELPSGWKLKNAEPKAQQKDARLQWDLGILDAGAERRFTVEVEPITAGDFRSCATVTFTADSCLNTVITQPRLELTKTGPETARLNEQAVFQLRLTNVGNGPAFGVVLHDDLPAGLEHESGASIDAEIGTLGPGESKQLALSTKATKPGRHLNKASAWAENAAAVQAEAAVVVTEAALSMKKTGPAGCFVNREVDFALEVSNPGTAAATNVRVLDPIPDGLEFVAASDGGAYVAASRTVTWTLGTLEPGSQKTLKLKVIGSRAGDFVNRATIQGDRGLEAVSSAPLHVEGVPALLLEVVDLDDPSEVGSETTYEIRVFNQGSDPSTGLRILATVPDGMVPESATGPAPYRVQGQQVIFEPLAKLAPRADVLFRVRVKCKKAGDWRFKVQMSCDQFNLPVNEEESTRVYKY